MAAQTTSRTYGWCLTTVTASFTAPARLLGYVDGLSRVPGDRCARFCGEEMVAISSPYPTTYSTFSHMSTLALFSAVEVHLGASTIRVKS